MISISCTSGHGLQPAAMRSEVRLPEVSHAVLACMWVGGKSNKAVFGHHAINPMRCATSITTCATCASNLVL